MLQWAPMQAMSIALVVVSAVVAGQPAEKRPAKDQPPVRGPIVPLPPVDAPAPPPATPPPAAPVPFPHPLITEVLYAVPNTPGSDANQDGTRHVAGDEFVELINPHDK